MGIFVARGRRLSAFVSLCLLVAGSIAITTSTATCQAQAIPAGATQQNSGGFLIFGGGNTQFPYYADNALGFTGGYFWQPRTWIGVEARAGYYPDSARFAQAPFLGAYRVGRLPSADRRWLPYGFFGMGGSMAKDSDAHFNPTGAELDRTWQGGAGVDWEHGRYAVRVIDLSWVETYTSRRTLRTPYLNVGVVYHFGKK